MIEFTVSGDVEILVKLSKIGENINVEKILDEAEALALNRIRTRFLAEVDPEYNPWKPSEAGLLRRAQGGTGTLFDTGTLFHSIQAFASGPNERTIGTDVPYARVHHFGLGHQEARPFLAFGAEDLTLMEKLVEKRVKEALE